MAFNQFINPGAKVRLEPQASQRFVITGRASGSVIEAVVAAGQSFTVSANSESLRIDAFDVAGEDHHLNAIPFVMTQV